MDYELYQWLQIVIVVIDSTPQIDFPGTRHSYQIRSKVKRNPRTFLGTFILSKGWGFNFNISFVEELDVIKMNKMIMWNKLTNRIFTKSRSDEYKLCKINWTV